MHWLLLIGLGVLVVAFVLIHKKTAEAPKFLSLATSKLFSAKV